MKEEIFLKNLGKKLRKARNKSVLSLEDAADGADISASFLGKVERGENCPSAITLGKLAKIYNVSADYLLEGVKTYDEQLVEAGKRLTPDQKETMRGALQPQNLDYKSKKALLNILESLVKK